MADKYDLGTVFCEKVGEWVVSVWQNSQDGLFYWTVRSKRKSAPSIAGDYHRDQSEAQRCAVAIYEALEGKGKR